VPSRAREIRRLASERLGFDTLHPGQLESVESVLAGRDTLCIMSTGSGKSAIYQLAGPLLDGPTVVVSPLIALQRDQVEAIEAIGRPTVLALTATAAPPVREDIVATLAQRDPAVIVRGFDRPNIHLAVERFHDEGAKRRALIEAVQTAEPPGIVYVATKRASTELALKLSDRGVRACAYHGGMAAGRRNEVQERFMEDAGCDVVVATVAFGMGVDKPNVRWVFHEHVSDSVDSYYQELGRAGRDGEPARAKLFYRPEDLGLRRFFAAGAVDPEATDRIARLLVAARRPVDPTELLEEAGVSRTKLATALHRLEEAGAVRTRDDGTVRAAVAGEPQVEEAVDKAATAEEERLSFDRSRVEMVRSYAEHHGCRRAFLLAYFGQEFEPPCGRCDNCERGLGARSDAGMWVGERVAHDKWGEGTVAQVDDGHVTVVFDSVGYRTLDAGLVADRGLLARVAVRRRA
jgi:ATP-dependent DNA helicase RecQ